MNAYRIAFVMHLEIFIVNIAIFLISSKEFLLFPLMSWLADSISGKHNPTYSCDLPYFKSFIPSSIWLQAVHSGADLDSAIANCMGYKAEVIPFILIFSLANWFHPFHNSSK